MLGCGVKEKGQHDFDMDLAHAAVWAPPAAKPLLVQQHHLFTTLSLSLSHTHTHAHTYTQTHTRAAKGTVTHTDSAHTHLSLIFCMITV